jgi:hypothetical protein
MLLDDSDIIRRDVFTCGLLEVKSVSSSTARAWSDCLLLVLGKQFLLTEKASMPMAPKNIKRSRIFIWFLFRRDEGSRLEG